jgi:hypothetical protein
MTIRTIIAALAVSAAVISCQKGSDSPVVARVGRSVLTLEELHESIPPEYSDNISREQMINYVKKWMDTELLYQEALRRKVHKEEKIRARLEKMKKDLLGAELISRVPLSDGKSQIAEEEARAYFEQRKDSFVREEDALRFVEIVVDGAKTAWNVRNQVTSDNFLDLAVRYSKSPVQDPRAVPFIPLSSLPPQIEKAIGNLREGGTSLPVEMDDGYHIVRVIEKAQEGEHFQFQEIRDEIMSTLYADLQVRQLDKLLSDLRLKTDCELDLNLIPKRKADDSDEMLDEQAMDDSNAE